MSVQIDVLLIRGADRQSVPTQLVTTTEKHLADYDQFWKPQLQRANAEDSVSDWDWKQCFLSLGEWLKVMRSSVSR